MHFLSGFLVALLAQSASSSPSQVHFDSLPDAQFDNHKNVAGFNLDLDEMRLIQFLPDMANPVWLTERQKLKAKNVGLGFIDITEHPWVFPGTKQHPVYPDLVGSNATKIVSKILPTLSTKEPEITLRRLTSFYTRYYNSDYGKASSEYLESRIQDYITEYTASEERNVTVTMVQHKFKQNSIIVRLAGPNATETDPITVVGAHCDSMNYANPFLRSPGADDDGSGTVTILEALRGILASGYIPTSPLEFHFYAAEEGGLLGSVDIVSRYEAAGKNIRGMEQFDMTAWVKNGTTPAIAIFTNAVDATLTKFQKGLVDKYRNAASDHFSWTRAGYASCHATEAPFQNMNRNVHTVNDKIDWPGEFSFDHMLHYSKLAVAFAVELSNY
ncbi:peptidase [Mycena floridula]|nr:peptidase [Mycena floridula]